MKTEIHFLQENKYFIFLAIGVPKCVLITFKKLFFCPINFVKKFCLHQKMFIETILQRLQPQFSFIKEKSMK